MSKPNQRRWGGLPERLTDRQSWTVVLFRPCSGLPRPRSATCPCNVVAFLELSNPSKYPILVQFDQLMLCNRYDPHEIESNNRQYMSRGEVPASSDARKLAWSLCEVDEDKGGAGQNSLPRASL